MSDDESTLVYPVSSGVVGRERMGTAFPHKKLSGKERRSHKRNFERYIFY